jgi:hypothetical protein
VVDGRETIAAGVNTEDKGQMVIDDYVLSGTTMSAYPYTRIVTQIVPDYKGQEITFAADGSTQSFSFEIPVTPEYRGYGGTWGILENYYLMFYVRAQYGTDWKDWEEGGDAMSDVGFRYPIRVKANYGPARTGHAYFTTINGEVTTVTINQAAFSLPVIHRRHYGMTFRSYGMDQGRNMTNWMMNVMSNNVNDLGEDEFNFAETCHGEPFPDELCVTTGYYYWGGWGVIDGRVAINEWVGENNASIPSVTAMIPPIIAETDEYYLPVTAIAIKSCSANLETRHVDVTVEVYAAKAGTYLLRGHLLDRSSSYTPDGAMYRAGMRNTIMKFFTSPKGDKLVFDTDRSTKTLSYSVTAPDEFSYGEVGGWGKLEDELVMFFTEVPFPAGCRVNATAESNMHGHYIDNSRFAEFGDVQELEVTP